MTGIEDIKHIDIFVIILLSVVRLKLWSVDNISGIIVMM